MQLIETTKQLGEQIRQRRKYIQMTLKQVSGLTGFSMRFLSEVERGKTTAEVGKVLLLMRYLGIDLLAQPRGKQK